MAAAPRYKVYADDGSYQAAVKELEAGAMLMLLYGPGATVRDGHSPARTLWTARASMGSRATRTTMQ